MSERKEDIKKEMHQRLTLGDLVQSPPMQRLFLFAEKQPAADLVRVSTALPKPKMVLANYSNAILNKGE